MTRNLKNSPLWDLYVQARSERAWGDLRLHLTNFNPFFVGVACHTFGVACHEMSKKKKKKACIFVSEVNATHTACYILGLFYIQSCFFEVDFLCKFPSISVLQRDLSGTNRKNIAGFVCSNPLWKSSREFTITIY